MAKKLTQLDLLEKAKQYQEDALAKDIPISCGIMWGGDKETGNVYHAYCAWWNDNSVEHSKYKEGVHSGFFEDCIQGHNAKMENANVARKQGWVIGRGKYSYYAICPMCVKRLQEENKNAK